MSASASLSVPPLDFPRRRGRPRIHPVRDTAFGCARDFLDNRFVFLVVTPRVHGLLAGINLAPDKRCNFRCCYCEVDRTSPPRANRLDVPAMAAELERTLQFVQSGRLRERPAFRTLPPDLLQVGHVAFAGDGEPTLCPDLTEAVEAVVHIRAQRVVPTFKLLLVTNASTLDAAAVQECLRFFTHDDEIWVKLDAGTQEWMDQINHSPVPLEKVLANILILARQRPVVIQTMFPALNGEGPSPAEVEAYARRLRDLKSAGARISMTQICSATRPAPRSCCSHLGLRMLSRVAYNVRQATGLRVEIF